MKDLRLNPETNDLDVANFDLALVEDIDQIRQKLDTKLKFFSGEWFLDGTAGMPLYERIFVKNPDLRLIQTAIKSTILDVEEVNSILAYSQTYSPIDRTLEVSFKVDTIFGTLESTTEVGNG